MEGFQYEDIIVDDEGFYYRYLSSPVDGFCNIIGLAKMRQIHVINIKTGEVLSEYIETGYNQLWQFKKFIPLNEKLKNSLWLRVKYFIFKKI